MGVVGRHWRRRWARPRLAHVGAREAGGRGGGAGNASGGGGRNRRSDGAMFGNGRLPNIAIISNQCLNYCKHYKAHLVG